MKNFHFTQLSKVPAGMHKLFCLTLAGIMFTAVSVAQAPQKMSYQAVIRNASNNLVTNTQVGMRISILQTTANGTAVYVERQTPTTNSNGLASLEVGAGTLISGSFSGINWTAGPYFIKIETDPSGGTSYTITGTSQLLSVPYALYAAGSPPTAISAGSNVSITGAGTTGNPYVINSTGSGGGLTLPYSATQSSNSTLFALTNSNSTAISGSSGIATGVNGISDSLSGVYGQSKHSTFAGVWGYNAGIGNGVEGEASNSGVGVYGKSYSGYGVYGISTYGDGIYGKSNKINNGIGIFGICNNTSGVGVYGNANVGAGVKGYSNSGQGIYGATITGSALYGNSTSGYALETVGKVKISGANTNPGQGKVLTSDANGNATWEGGIAFAVSGTNSSYQSISPNSERQQRWSTEEYDLGNNFDMASYAFTAPVNGIYHFNASIWVGLSDESEREFGIFLYRLRDAVSTVLRKSWVVAGVSDDAYSAGMSTDVKLNAGDKVYLTIVNSYTYTVPITTGTTGCWMSGHLVVKQ